MGQRPEGKRRAPVEGPASSTAAPAEMARVMNSLNLMLAAKDDALKEVSFLVVRMQKTFNDAYETVCAKFQELGIAQSEIKAMNFGLEALPVGSSSGPAGLLATSF